MHIILHFHIYAWYTNLLLKLLLTCLTIEHRIWKLRLLQSSTFSEPIEHQFSSIDLYTCVYLALFLGTPSSSKNKLEESTLDYWVHTLVPRLYYHPLSIACNVQKQRGKAWYSLVPRLSPCANKKKGVSLVKIYHVRNVLSWLQVGKQMNACFYHLW